MGGEDMALSEVAAPPPLPLKLLRLSWKGMSHSLKTSQEQEGPVHEWQDISVGHCVGLSDAIAEEGMGISTEAEDEPHEEVKEIGLVGPSNANIASKFVEAHVSRQCLPDERQEFNPKPQGVEELLAEVASCPRPGGDGGLAGNGEHTHGYRDRMLAKSCTEPVNGALTSFVKALSMGGQPHQSILDTVIQSYMRIGEVEMAELWLEWMVGNGMKPGRTSFASIMKQCSQAGQIASVEDWLKKMEKVGLAPNHHSYNVVTHACVQAGCLSRAEEWLQVLLQNSNQPSIISFNTVIHAHSRRGHVQSAEHWLREILNAGLMPSVVTFGSVINACAEAGAAERAEWWLGMMSQEVGLTPNEFCYNTVIKAFVNTGKISKAEEWMRRMTADGFDLNAVTYNLLIKAYAQSGDIATAEACLVRMVSRRCPANKITYNTLINACAAAGQVDRAEMWLDHMLKAGISPDDVTFGSMCKVYARDGNYKQVLQVMDSLAGMNIAVNEYFYASLINACGNSKPRRADLAEEAFKRCLAQGLRAESVVRVLQRAIGYTRTSHLCRACGVDEVGRHEGTPATCKPAMSTRSAASTAATARKGTGGNRPRAWGRRGFPSSQ